MLFSKRILSLVNDIPKNKVVLDIGFDHAKVLIYLALHKDLQQGFGIENKQQPFENGKLNVHQHHLKNKITLFLDQDPAIFKALSNAKYIVISGLGISSVVSIFQKYSKFLENKIILLQLSEIKQTPKLRIFLNKQNFIIKKETFITDKTHFYINVICKQAKKNIPKYNEDDIYIGPKLKKNKPESYISYLRYITWYYAKNNPQFAKKIEFQVIKKWLVNEDLS